MPNLATLSNLATLHGPKADISDQTKETIAEVLTTAIINASNASIPKSTVTKKSKPWWDDNLRDLRKKMANIGRKSQNNPYLRQEYQTAKNQYFNAIKRAKTDHWNQFLEKEDPQSIFKAMAYTKDIIV